MVANITFRVENRTGRLHCKELRMRYVGEGLQVLCTKTRGLGKSLILIKVAIKTCLVSYVSPFASSLPRITPGFILVLTNNTKDLVRLGAVFLVWSRDRD